LRLAAGKSVRQVLKALPPPLVITEEDIAQATFDITDEGLLVAVAGIVGVDKARLVQAVLAERALRVDWNRDVAQHPLAGAVGIVRATPQ
jgi:alkylated DNA nucleotide flippase Atl1